MAAPNFFLGFAMFGYFARDRLSIYDCHDIIILTKETYVFYLETINMYVEKCRSQIIKTEKQIINQQLVL